jgi:hypothetical protein
VSSLKLRNGLHRKSWKDLDQVKYSTLMRSQAFTAHEMNACIYYQFHCNKKSRESWPNIVAIYVTVTVDSFMAILSDEKLISIALFRVRKTMASTAFIYHIWDSA